MRTGRFVGRARPLAAVAVASLVTLSAAPASAYVGPGAGLSAIGALMALIAVFFLAVVGFVWYPLKRLVKGNGTKQTKESDSAGT